MGHEKHLPTCGVGLFYRRKRLLVIILCKLELSHLEMKIYIIEHYRSLEIISPSVDRYK